MIDRLTGIHVAYYHVCKRKLWMWSRGIQLEEVNTQQNVGQQKVAEANTLQDTTYRRRAEAGKQLMIELPGFAGRVDFYDAKTGLVHETKPSNKLAEAHRWQLRFYLWLIRESGIGNAKGVLEYPKQKLIEEVELTEEDVKQLHVYFDAIRKLIELPNCPPVINKPRCKSCSYFDLCYVGEIDSD